ncbi:NADH-ubiquinone/plastoquinone (complex I) protein [Medicago truncatula]|uniref:NADH-ubiquinone/plastoquinone (Complex I) protein n=1 Tax=Medicago truncatula TaxID=3880 RepID=G7KGC0_MEDTR|nr:NADH-ubiquinone/plastoquinone (complex I) protein [Medicago truncatula]
MARLVTKKVGAKSGLVLRLAGGGSASDLNCIRCDDGDDLDDSNKEHYPPFVIPKKMTNFKWVLGARFGTKNEFKEAITNYTCQRILKKRIAYSSVSHMGFIILGIGSINDIRLNRAVLQIISHGFIGTALFFLAGTSYDRLRFLYLDEMGGMAIPMPKIFTIFTILSMTSLALLGMNDFVAELIVFFWNIY